MKLWELPFGEAANEDYRQRPLARFVRAENLHGVAASIAHAQGRKPQSRFHHAPEFGERQRRLCVEPGCRFRHGCVERIQRGRLAAIL